jgi:3-deoxy-D-manno-octulosonic-acid transferase
VESELWPNLIFAARRSGARLALVSAKMSDQSFRTWRRFRSASRTTLGAFDLILARDAQAGARFEALGGPVGGLWDAKLGAPPLSADEGELQRLRNVLGDRPVILAASTHPGEEEDVIRAFKAVAAPTALLIIAPRHVGRGAEVERAAREGGLTVARRGAREGSMEVQVFVADTMGELGLWYRLSALAIVGGSLAEGVGGHNPLEPARLGCPFVSGPYVAHWPIYRDLVGAGATRLLDGPDELVPWLRRALAGDPSLRAMADRAAAYTARRDVEGEAVAPRLLSLLAP